MGMLVWKYKSRLWTNWYHEIFIWCLTRSCDHNMPYLYWITVLIVTLAHTEYIPLWDYTDIYEVRGEIEVHVVLDIRNSALPRPSSDIIKGLIMDRCVLLTSTPESVVSPRPRDRPVAGQNTRELMSTTHTYPWLIPIITWCRQFPWLYVNILLSKSKL